MLMRHAVQLKRHLLGSWGKCFSTYALACIFCTTDAAESAIKHTTPPPAPSMQRQSTVPVQWWQPRHRKRVSLVHWQQILFLRRIWLGGCLFGSRRAPPGKRGRRHHMTWVYEPKSGPLSGTCSPICSALLVYRSSKGLAGQPKTIRRRRLRWPAGGCYGGA